MNDFPPTKKSLGQHWLNDPACLEDICDHAQISDQDTVLEIGPGPGTLTALLVKRAARVIAVELDASLADTLKQRVKANNLEVINEDILDFNLARLPKSYIIVANIPYYLTSNLVRVISESPNPPKSATLLVQDEVAERLAAKPGNMSVLSVTAQFYWQVSLGNKIKAEHFTPPPKVDSRIVRFERLEAAAHKGVDSKIFFRVVKAGFSQKRKTLLNSLSAGLHGSREEIEECCKKAGIDTGRRPQTLSMEEWLSIYRSL